MRSKKVSTHEEARVVLRSIARHGINFDSMPSDYDSRSDLAAYLLLLDVMVEQEEMCPGRRPDRFRI